MANLKIKLVKSLNGRLEKHIATAESLGLRKIGNVTIQPDNTQTRGKIAKIGYLLEVTGIFGAGKVLMRPAPEGTGVIAGGAVRAVMEAVGIKNICAKCLRSNNPQNVVKATMQGLMSLRTPEEVAQIRSKTVEEINGK